MNKIKLYFSLFTVLCVISGCKTLPSESERETNKQTANLNLSGYPKAFQEGYADGCSTAKSLVKQQNATRFKTDTQYAQGWRDGNDLCKKH
jgi:hypothetical protein